MGKDPNERIHQYIDALEKTNKHLIIALQKMLEYTARLEEVSKKSIARMRDAESDSGEGDIEWHEKLIKPTIPLFERILKMSEEDQRALLAELDKKPRKKTG